MSIVNSYRNPAIIHCTKTLPDPYILFETPDRSKLYHNGEEIHINSADDNNETILHYLCSMPLGELDFIKTLIGLGADITIENADGKTAADCFFGKIHSSFKRNGKELSQNHELQSGICEVVLQMVKAGLPFKFLAHVGLHTTINIDLFDFACEIKSFELMNKLTEAGFEIDPNKYLDHVIDRNNDNAIIPEMFSELKKLGVRPDQIIDGKNIFFYAKDTKELEWLFEETKQYKDTDNLDLNAKNISQETLIVNAAHLAKFDIVELLVGMNQGDHIPTKIHLDSHDKDGYHLVSLLMKANQFDLVKEIEKQGVSLEEIKNPESLVQSALDSENIELVKYTHQKTNTQIIPDKIEVSCSENDDWLGNSWTSDDWLSSDESSDEKTVDDQPNNHLTLSIVFDNTFKHYNYPFFQGVVSYVKQNVAEEKTNQLIAQNPSVIDFLNDTPFNELVGKKNFQQFSNVLNIHNYFIKDNSIAINYAMLSNYTNTWNYLSCGNDEDNWHIIDHQYATFRDSDDSKYGLTQEDKEPFRGAFCDFFNGIQSSIDDELVEQFRIELPDLFDNHYDYNDQNTDSLIGDDGA